MSTPTEVKHKRNPLYKLPPELRQQIFYPLLINWEGKTPDLIKALRPDRKLYHEALEIFYKQNIFGFYQANNWSFGDLSKDAVLRIERAALDVVPEIMSTGLWKVGGSSNEESLLTPNIPIALCDARNIHEVTLVFSRTFNNAVIAPFIEYGTISYSANYFLLPFERLQRVEMWLPQPWFRESDLETWRAEREESYMNGIKMVNDRLGVPGKLLTVPVVQIEQIHGGEDEWTAENSLEGWFWQAAEGTFLNSSKMRGAAGDKFFS